MELEFAYWHWLVLGIGLVIVEIFLPSFTIFWFWSGGYYCRYCFMALPYDGSRYPACPYGLFASCGFALFWFKALKPKMIDKTTAGIAREAAIGESGQVIKTPHG